MPSLIEIGPVVLEKILKMWKVYRQMDGQTDDRQNVIRIAHLSFQLRWAKNLNNHLYKYKPALNFEPLVWPKNYRRPQSKQLRINKYQYVCILVIPYILENDQIYFLLIYYSTWRCFHSSNTFLLNWFSPPALIMKVQLQTVSFKTMSISSVSSSQNNVYCLICLFLKLLGPIFL